MSFCVPELAFHFATAPAVDRVLPHAWPGCQHTRLGVTASRTVVVSFASNTTDQLGEVEMVLPPAEAMMPVLLPHGMYLFL